MGVVIMNELNLSYIAGLVDGEAYIGIKRQKPNKKFGRTTQSYQARLKIKMATPDGLEFVANTFGFGSVKQEKKKYSKLSNYAMYRLEYMNLQAEKVLSSLLPYLKVKKDVAIAVLQFCNLKKQSSKHKTKPAGTRNFPNKYGVTRIVINYELSDEYISMCDSLYSKCKELNS